MRNINHNMAAMLASGATSLCHCWKLTRKPAAEMPGVNQSAERPAIYGFTDHDAPLIFDGITYEAVSGFTASAIESGLGLKVDNLEVEGALSSSTLDEDDIAKGVYDDAQVDIYRVNWRDVSQRVLLRRGNLGEIRRTAWGFSAELRGLAHRLAQPGGRLYQHLCDADLGDRRCGVDLSQHSQLASVVSVNADNRIITLGSTLDRFATGWFAGGRIAFVSGKNQGQNFDVRDHIKDGSIVRLELWQAAPHPIAVNDQLTILPGCNKSFSVCRVKFNNHKNFQGFPHIPGNDFAQYYPRS